MEDEDKKVEMPIEDIKDENVVKSEPHGSSFAMGSSHVWSTC